MYTSNVLFRMDNRCPKVKAIAGTTIMQSPGSVLKKVRSDLKERNQNSSPNNDRQDNILYQHPQTFSSSTPLICSWSPGDNSR